MEKSKKRVLLVAVIAVVIAGVLMMTGEIKLPSVKDDSIVKMNESNAQTTEQTNNSEEKISNNPAVVSSGIVFYTQDGCIYCKNAMDFIEREYPNLGIEIINIGSDVGYEKFVKAARSKKIRHPGTPLFMLNETEYLIGWGKENEIKFKAFVEEKLNYKK